MQGLTVIQHPLIEHKLTRIRDKNTSSQDFRRLLNEVAGLMTLFNFTWSGGRSRLENDGLWVESLLELNLRESARAVSGDTA